MPGRDDVTVWVRELGNFRTRAKARKQLERCGSAVAEQVVPLLSDGSLPENVRWAAIMVVKAWGYAPAAPLLLQVVRTHSGLRGAAIQALEALTGLAIGYAPDEWEHALADLEAYRREHQEPEALALALADPNGEPDGCRLFRQALGNLATEITWEDNAYLYLRMALEGGRKQQIVVTFSELDSSGKPLTTMYTECGALRPEVVDSIARRNLTARYGKFYTQKDEKGNDIVVMRETVPALRLTPKLARDIVLSIAGEADSLELEMTGADRI
jgi:hypothetical protein